MISLHSRIQQLAQFLDLPRTEGLQALNPDHVAHLFSRRAAGLRRNHYNVSDRLARPITKGCRLIE